jgi:hypothetical protein
MKKHPKGCFLVAGSGFRTTDLRVMRENPDFGIFDLKTMQISEKNEPWFR